MFWRRKPKIIEKHYCNNLLITIKLLDDGEGEYSAVNLSKAPKVIHYIFGLNKNDKTLKNVRDMFNEENDYTVSFFHPSHRVVALLGFSNGGQMWVHM